MSAPDPFTPIPLFAFPLFSTVLAGYDDHKSGLVAEILEARRADPGIQRSNRNAWHSGESLRAAPGPHLLWVLEKALAYAGRALARNHQDWSTSELRMGTYWANVVGAGGWNAPHHHFPTHWSGVFYASVGPVSTAPDDLGGRIEFLNPTPWHSVLGRGGNFVYGPRDGVMLLFPASLVHFVHPHFNDEQRISVAYNFSVYPKAAPQGR